MRFNQLKLNGSTDVARQCASEEGFTLIETSIAMVLMMISALGVASLFTYSITNNTGANDRAVAISLAQQQLEQLRSVPFTDTILNVTAATVLSPDTVNNGRSYRVTRTVTGSNNNVSGNPTLKTITIRVEPRGAGWTGLPVILRTIRSATSTGTY